MPSRLVGYWYKKYVKKIKRWRQRSRREARRRNAWQRGFQIARAANRWAGSVWEQPYIPRGGIVTPTQVYHTTHWGSNIGGDIDYLYEGRKEGKVNRAWMNRWKQFLYQKPTREAALRWSEQEADRRNRNYVREVKDREKALERIGEGKNWYSMIQRTADAALETAGAVANIVQAFNA